MPAEVVRDLCTSYVSEEDCRRLILSHLLQEEDTHGWHSKDHLRECAQNARIKEMFRDVHFPAPRATTVDMALGLDKISDEPERPRKQRKVEGDGTSADSKHAPSRGEVARTVNVASQILRNGRVARTHIHAAIEKLKEQNKVT